MFTPRMTEDPATGSAAAATGALLAAVDGGGDLQLRVGQGFDMGRPSLLAVRVEARQGATRVYVGGRCAAAMQGSLLLAAGVW